MYDNFKAWWLKQTNIPFEKIEQAQLSSDEWVWLTNNLTHLEHELNRLNTIYLESLEAFKSVKYETDKTFSKSEFLSAVKQKNTLI
jgi:hypothetical protein